MTTLTYQNVEEKIITIRHQKVILDADVSELYGVETKRINEAVSRNPEKFPEGYIFQITKEEKKELVANCDRFDVLKYSTSLPKAFTERGLYMLATILKSPSATQTTLLIIDTFAKVRELGRIVHQVQELPENSPKQKALVERTGELISDLIIPDENLETTDTETTIEMNLAILKIKKIIKKSQKNKN